MIFLPRLIGAVQSRSSPSDLPFVPSLIHNAPPIRLIAKKSHRAGGGNTFQSGFLSIFYSLGSDPLQLWEEHEAGEGGSITFVVDEDIQSKVVQVVAKNISNTYLSCPANPKQALGIKLPFLVFIIKNMNRYFSFEVEVMDDKNFRRRLRASNYQSKARVKPYICTMPLKLADGWNLIQINLEELTRKAYGSSYVETLRVQMHANCRLRRISFAERLYSEDDLPPEFKLFLPASTGAASSGASSSVTFSSE
ncbi:Cilia- and flagella-associated protein 20 [Balamuthia mandrillaris]